MTDFDPDAYRNWTPAAQQAALERMQRMANDRWRPFYCKRADCDGKPHGEWTWNHARADQRPPTDREWLTWLLKSGRGAGKTRVGSEYTHRMTKVVSRIAIVGATGADVRDTMLEGESGILTIAPPGSRPRYEPSKRRLTWPNGCVGTTFSAEEPDRLRGPEHGFAWCDEPAHWALVEDAWDNLLFGLRMGRWPRIVATTTPKPRKWLKALMADPTTRIATGSTYANVDNLSPVFAQRVIAKYEGTRLGRQELHGEMLEDVEGALWTYELIDSTRVPPVPRDVLTRVVVAVDPAGSSRSTANETAIVVCGLTGNGHVYVLEDRSGHYTPHGWAAAVSRLHDEWNADAVVAETNYGGEMVESQLRLGGFKYRLLTVHARVGKAVRAEPVVGLFEQNRAHLAGTFPELEAQMTEWVPYEKGQESPDRLDAMVYGLLTLSMRPGKAHIASPTELDAAVPQLTRGSR